MESHHELLPGRLDGGRRLPVQDGRQDSAVNGPHGDYSSPVNGSENRTAVGSSCTCTVRRKECRLVSGAVTAQKPSGENWITLIMKYTRGPQTCY